MKTEDGIRERERLRKCLQCGAVLENGRLLHCTESCRLAWLRARGLMQTKEDLRKHQSRVQRGVARSELRGLQRRAFLESSEYLERLSAP
jgi:Fe-S-cluster-containing dehydrogenase component